MKRPKGLIIQTESRLLYIELKYVMSIASKEILEENLQDVFVCWTYD